MVPKRYLVWVWLKATVQISPTNARSLMQMAVAFHAAHYRYHTLRQMRWRRHCDAMPRTVMTTSKADLCRQFTRDNNCRCTLRAVSRCRRRITNCYPPFSSAETRVTASRDRSCTLEEKTTDAVPRLITAEYGRPYTIVILQKQVNNSKH